MRGPPAFWETSVLFYAVSVVSMADEMGVYVGCVQPELIFMLDPMNEPKYGFKLNGCGCCRGFKSWCSVRLDIESLGR